MKRATGGGLPAHIFHAFMEDAEQNLPIRPLAGMTLLASAAPNPMQTAQTQKPEEPHQPDALERIINGIFGGT
jgi:hypothetical protein